MELVVDLGRVTVVLARPQEVGDLTVRVGAPAGASPDREADVHRLRDVLEATHTGHLVDAGQAMVRPDAVRFHAAGQVADGWEDGFARLCRARSDERPTTAGPRAGTEPDGTVAAAVRWPGPVPDAPWPG